MKQATHVADPAERYAALQRRLQGLERLHADEKKSYQNDLQTCKNEIARSQKTNSELQERLEKLKKHASDSDHHIQELKKSSQADQGELRDLRAKLRALEQERKQLHAKQDNIAESKKAAQAMDTRRREEVRDRDRRIAELEKSLNQERKRADTAQAQLDKAKDEHRQCTDQTQAAASALQIQVDQKNAELEQTTFLLRAVRSDLGAERDALLSQVQRLRDTLSRVVQEYSVVAQSTVATSHLRRAKEELAVSQLQVLRLERKLANSEAQVREIAMLVRQYTDTTSFLDERLRDTEKDVRGLQIELLRVYNEQTSLMPQPDATAEIVRKLDQQRTLLENETKEALRPDMVLHRYQLQAEELISACQSLDAELRSEQTVAQSLTARLQAMQAAKLAVDTELASVQGIHLQTERDLASRTRDLANANDRVAIVEQQLATSEGVSRRETAKYEKALLNEREAAQRLAAALQKSKMAEEAYVCDIERFESELADAELFKQAYYNLLEEVGALVDRNELAEQEAERLSHLNAEILGHRNLGQRIYYVDKIRKELANTKQELLVSTRDRENVIADNQLLKRELNMYKSVSVPYEGKPRTAITRVARMPLAVLDRNNNVDAADDGESASAPVRLEETEFSVRHIPEFEQEMTLDELL